jgi:hypothetical protein
VGMPATIHLWAYPDENKDIGDWGIQYEPGREHTTVLASFFFHPNKIQGSINEIKFYFIRAGGRAMSLWQIISRIPNAPSSVTHSNKLNGKLTVSQLPVISAADLKAKKEENIGKTGNGNNGRHPLPCHSPTPLLLCQLLLLPLLLVILSAYAN